MSGGGASVVQGGGGTGGGGYRGVQGVGVGVGVGLQGGGRGVQGVYGWGVNSPRSGWGSDVAIISDYRNVYLLCLPPRQSLPH